MTRPDAEPIGGAVDDYELLMLSHRQPGFTPMARHRASGNSSERVLRDHAARGGTIRPPPHSITTRSFLSGWPIHIKKMMMALWPDLGNTPAAFRHA